MLLSSFLTFQSCSNDDDDEMMNVDRQMFVTQAASGNMLEIQAGALAMQNGQSTAVKTYGEHMVNDHTQASAELASIANQKQLTVPTQLTEKHQAQLNSLKPLTGTSFDKAFMNMMVSSHQEQVSLFEQASIGVDDDELRELASNKLPVLRAHLQEAQQLNGTINP